MGELSKNLKFNNGNPISFESIKENREQAVEELSEGNDGLKALFNVCIDNDVKTIVSCGDKTPHISFEINDKNRNYLINLVAILDKFYNNDKKIFDIKIGSYKKMNDLFLDVRILTSVQESIKYFRLMSEILAKPIKFETYEKFELMEKLVLNLSQYARSIFVNLSYSKLSDNIFNDFADFGEYNYTLYVSGIYIHKGRQLNKVLSKTDYYLGGTYCDYYGIIDNEGLKSLINASSMDNNKESIVDIIKNKVLIKK